METLKKRGRAVGQTKTASYIKDPILHPYAIEIEERAFNVVDLRELQGQQFVAAYSDIGKCITKIQHFHLAEKRKTYDLSSFIKEYRDLKKNLETLLDS